MSIDKVRVKTFYDTRHYGLESDINKWLESADGKIEVLSIHYSTTFRPVGFPELLEKHYAFLTYRILSIDKE